MCGKKGLFYVFLCCLLLTSFSAQAQLSVNEDFKGSGTPGIVLGDTAVLTSGTVDPAGAGWLRLTEASGNQQGYAYIDQKFPSNLGILVDFEYKMWRKNAVDDNGKIINGADGIGVFLFDGEIDQANFKLGGYGGSLGYAPNFSDNGKVDPGDTGLSGGYIGIGLDAFGNFSNPTEGRNGDANPDPDANSGPVPDAIALRGPTTSDRDETNYYLDGVAVASISPGMTLDYNEEGNSRPSDEEYYRRVQLELLPVEEPDGTTHYTITVRWATEKGGELVDLINYDASSIPPPETLKLGFAASTGGSYNYHEIRNLVVSTPGNPRVTNKADTDMLSVQPGKEEITYSIEVVNDIDVDLDDNDFELRLTDAFGNLLDTDSFEITGISYDNFTTAPDLSEYTTSNLLFGKLGLAAHSTGIITVTGVLKQIPQGNRLVSTAHFTTHNVDDEDLGNNTATVETLVQGVGVDLNIRKWTNEPCYDPAGNTFHIEVSNIGSETYYNADWEIVVTNELPEGNWDIDIDNADQWDVDISGASGDMIFTWEGDDGWGDDVEAGMSLPIITYTVHYEKEPFTYAIPASVEGEAFEADETNNSSLPTGIVIPPEAGSLSGNLELCRNMSPSIVSTDSGEVIASAAVISYRWESSPVGEDDWQTIPGATSASYDPGPMTESLKFRRFGVATIGSVRCESAPTEEVVVEVRRCMAVSNPMLYSPGAQ